MFWGKKAGNLERPQHELGSVNTWPYAPNTEQYETRPNRYHPSTWSMSTRQHSLSLVSVYVWCQLKTMSNDLNYTTYYWNDIVHLCRDITSVQEIWRMYSIYFSAFVRRTCNGMLSADAIPNNLCASTCRSHSLGWVLVWSRWAFCGLFLSSTLDGQAVATVPVSFSPVLGIWCERVLLFGWKMPRFVPNFRSSTPGKCARSWSV